MSIGLIVGSTGAGKTTYARKLAMKTNGIVHSIDNWMKELFGDDMPADPQPEWFHKNHQWYVERIKRCEKKIRQQALQSEKVGVPSLLDLGFSTAEHRGEFISFFKSHGIDIEIHFLDIPSNVRKARVEKRNQDRGNTFVMTVDDSLFEFMENIFEPPQENEGVMIKIISQN